MTETFLTFQNFNDIELANEFAKLLDQQGIPYLVEENKKFLDSGFSNNVVPDISIKLKPEDFLKANKALEDYYKTQLNEIDKDYYLFEFTDEELIEIIAKPDEWGRFDYQLAQKILRDRGKEVKPEIAGLLKTNRIKELAKPESVHRYLIYLGYVSAAVGGLIGIFIGWTFAYYKKTLPDGQRIYAYKEDVRNHGTRMLLLACISLVAFIIIRWRLFMSR